VNFKKCWKINELWVESCSADYSDLDDIFILQTLRTVNTYLRAASTKYGLLRVRGRKWSISVCNKHPDIVPPRRYSKNIRKKHCRKWANG